MTVKTKDETDVDDAMDQVEPVKTISKTLEQVQLGEEDEFDGEESAEGDEQDTMWKPTPAKTNNKRKSIDTSDQDIKPCKTLTRIKKLKDPSEMATYLKERICKVDFDGDKMCSEFTKWMETLKSYETMTQMNVVKMWDSIQTYKYHELAEYCQKVMKGTLYLKFMEKRVHTPENQENFLAHVLNLSTSPWNIQDLSECIFCALFHRVVSANSQDAPIPYYLGKIKEVDEHTGRIIKYSGINAKSLAFILEATIAEDVVENEWNLKVFWKKFNAETKPVDSQVVNSK